jgi:hypothetical protein
MFEGTGVPMDKVLAEFFATPTGKLIEANVDKVPVSELKDFRESKLKMIYQIRKELTRSVRNIPHARGGRPGLLHEDEKRQACKDVLRLVEDGEVTSATCGSRRCCKTRVGTWARIGCSASGVERD